VGLLGQAGDFIEAFRMTRREQQHGAWMRCRNFVECIEQEFFFASDGTAANEHRAGLEQGGVELANDERFRGERDVVFEISCSENLPRGGSDGDEAARVFRGLSEKKIVCRQYTEKESSPAEVLAKEAGRDSGVDDDNACAGLLGEAKEIRPEFGFGDHNKPRLKRGEPRTDGKRKIKREIKDVRLAEAGGDELLAGVGGGRDHSFKLGEIATQGADYLADREDLAHRDRVNPDGGPGLFKARRNASEALEKAFAVLAMAQGLE